MGGFPPNKNGKIEKVFQLPQTKPRPRPYTQYTKRSIYKKAYLNVLLLGILISQGYNEIQEIYKLKNSPKTDTLIYIKIEKFNNLEKININIL